MNTIEYLRNLYEYDDWANRRILTVLKAHNSERCRQIFAHMLTTKQEYFERLYGKDSTGFDFWPDLSLDECGELSRDTKERFEQLLIKFNDEGLGMKAAYRTSEGVPQTNTFREILTHVLF